MRNVRILLACLLAALPGRMRRSFATLVLKWDVHPTASIGRSLLVVDKVRLGPGSRIGTGNVIKGLTELRLEEEASIGHLNWISGPAQGSGAFQASPDRHPALVLHAGAAVTSRHIIDCSDTVTLETFAVLSGIRSTIFTHSVDLVRGQQRTGCVTIGERAAVLTNSLLLAGTAVAPRSIVSAGSVVNTVLIKENVFYRGNPATEVRELPANLGFFRRSKAYID